MDPHGILTTAAEIAIALAGFSGIAVAVSSARSAEWSEAAQLLFSALLLMSASSLFFAFLPLLVASAGAAESLAWRFGSGFHALWLTGVAVVRSRQAGRIRPNSDLDARPLGLLIGVILLQSANALWLQAAWPYLTGIVVMLLGGFYIFALLLGSLGWTR